MSPRAHFAGRTNRDRNEPDMVEEYVKQGASVRKIDAPCDLLVGLCGISDLVEVKPEEGPRGGSSHCQLSPNEAKFHAEWRGSIEVVQTREHVREHCQRLRARAQRLGFGRLDDAQARRVKK